MQLLWPLWQYVDGRAAQERCAAQLRALAWQGVPGVEAGSSHVQVQLACMRSVAQAPAISASCRVQGLGLVLLPQHLCVQSRGKAWALAAIRACSAVGSATVECGRCADLQSAGLTATEQSRRLTSYVSGCPWAQTALGLQAQAHQ